jgi:hypothetical protein
MLFQRGVILGQTKSAQLRSLTENLLTLTCAVEQGVTLFGRIEVQGAAFAVAANARGSDPGKTVEQIRLICQSFRSE